MIDIISLLDREKAYVNEIKRLQEVNDVDELNELKRKLDSAESKIQELVYVISEYQEVARSVINIAMELRQGNPDLERLRLFAKQGTGKIEEVANHE